MGIEGVIEFDTLVRPEVDDDTGGTLRSTSAISWNDWGKDADDRPLTLHLNGLLIQEGRHDENEHQIHEQEVVEGHREDDCARRGSVVDRHTGNHRTTPILAAKIGGLRIGIEDHLCEGTLSFFLSFPVVVVQADGGLWSRLHEQLERLLESGPSAGRTHDVPSLVELGDGFDVHFGCGVTCKTLRELLAVAFHGRQVPVHRSGQLHFGLVKASSLRIGVVHRTEGHVGGDADDAGGDDQCDQLADEPEVLVEDGPNSHSLNQDQDHRDADTRTDANQRAHEPVVVCLAKSVTDEDAREDAAEEQDELRALLGHRRVLALAPCSLDEILDPAPQELDQSVQHGREQHGDHAAQAQEAETDHAQKSVDDVTRCKPPALTDRPIERGGEQRDDDGDDRHARVLPLVLRTIEDDVERLDEHREHHRETQGNPEPNGEDNQRRLVLDDAEGRERDAERAGESVRDEPPVARSARGDLLDDVHDVRGQDGQDGRDDRNPDQEVDLGDLLLDESDDAHDEQSHDGRENAAPDLDLAGRRALAHPFVLFQLRATSDHALLDPVEPSLFGCDQMILGFDLLTGDGEGVLVLESSHLQLQGLDAHRQFADLLVLGNDLGLEFLDLPLEATDFGIPILDRSFLCRALVAEATHLVVLLFELGGDAVAVELESGELPFQICDPIKGCTSHLVLPVLSLRTRVSLRTRKVSTFPKWAGRCRWVEF